MTDKARIVHVSRDIAADPHTIFELIADPAQQPGWDGNDNLGHADEGQRVRAVGEIFVMTLKSGQVRENHVVEFEEDSRIAWIPAPPGEQPPGHLWRWELESLGDGRTRVTHTYDWTALTDEKRMHRAQQNTPQALNSSLDRLATLAESAD